MLTSFPAVCGGCWNLDTNAYLAPGHLQVKWSRMVKVLLGPRISVRGVMNSQVWHRGRWHACDPGCSVEELSVECTSMSLRLRSRLYATATYCSTFTIYDHFTCTSENLVYCISCCRCSHIYIGETGRSLRSRIGEHLRSVRNNTLDFLWHNISTLPVTVLQMSRCEVCVCVEVPTSSANNWNWGKWG